MTTKKRRLISPKRERPRRQPRLDYVLQGSEFDLPMKTVLAFSNQQRSLYINALLDRLAKTIRADKMSLKSNVSFKKEMRDLRRLIYAAPDQYLLLDEKTGKRNVLATGTPGLTHTYWSRTQMWKMKTKAGDLSKQIKEKSSSVGRQA